MCGLVRLNTLPGRSVPLGGHRGPVKGSRARVDMAKYQMSASPFPHCVTSPSPDRALRHLRAARFFLRSRLRVLDAFGRVLFRGEVAHAEARTMFGATRLVEEPESGVFDNRRYVRVPERVL